MSISVVINIKGNSYRLRGKMKLETMNELQNKKESGSNLTTEIGSI